MLTFMPASAMMVTSWAFCLPPVETTMSSVSGLSFSGVTLTILPLRGLSAAAAPCPRAGDPSDAQRQHHAIPLIHLFIVLLLVLMGTEYADSLFARLGVEHSLPAGLVYQ